MQAALETHRAKPPAPARGKPVLAEQYAAAQKVRKGECIHCHQVWEFRRHDLKTAGALKREDLWVYPLPENLGVALAVEQGNKVRSVAAGSAADKAGLRAGDVLLTLNGRPVHSFADAQYALHRAPDQGAIPLRWLRDGQPTDGVLAAQAGWRKTNWTWRPSMLDVLPALSLYGADLTPAEKKELNLADKRLAFRQDQTVHKEAQKLGVQAGDVIVGVDDAPLEMTMLQFLGYIRQTYLVGDKITLNVIRNGKRLDLPGKL